MQPKLSSQLPLALVDYLLSDSPYRMGDDGPATDLLRQRPAAPRDAPVPPLQAYRERPGSRLCCAFAASTYTTTITAMPAALKQE